jgi:DUF4097 and DUF4098 domain-containing protein YvlB
MQRISLVFSGVLVAAALTAPAFAQDVRGKNDSTFVWTGRIADGGTLTIKNIVGDISVIEASGDRVEVRAAKRTRGRDPGDVTFDVNESASSATICTVYRGESACDEGNFNNVRISVNYTIAMPRGLRLRASTGNGELSVDKAGSEVDLRTGNGAIHIGQTEGRVTATTGNGDLEVESAKGPVRVNSGNGRIFVSTASGPVSAHTGNGDVEVRMKALSTDADMDFRSGSGAIRVTLPADFNGEFEASTGNGELRSDFEIKVTGRFDPQHIRGVIGKGGRLIRLQTGNGRLEIRKGS